MLFSKIPLHLQKIVIHDMESEYGSSWSVKKIKKTNESKNPPKLRNKRRPVDVSVEVWKDLVKAYEKVDALRKLGKEST